MFLYGLIAALGKLSSIEIEYVSSFSFSLYAFYILIILFAGVQLWRLKIIGWILSCGIVIMNLVFSVLDLYMEWQFMNTISGFADGSAFETLFPAKGYVYFVVTISLFGIVLWLLLRKFALKQFPISKFMCIVTVLVSILFCVGIIFLPVL